MNTEPQATNSTGTGNGLDHEAATVTERAPQMPRMPWYPSSFAGATRGWPLVARGAYRELLDAQWDMASLPADPRELRTIAAATPGEWRTAWPFVEPKFPIGPDGLRRNARLEAHRAKALELHEAKRAAGVAGAQKRWGDQ